MEHHESMLAWRAVAVLVVVAVGCGLAGLALAGGGQNSQLPEAIGPVCTVSPSGAAICAGTTVMFTCSATGGVPGYNYCWEKEPYGGQCLSTAETLVLANVVQAASGQYRVIVTDANSVPDTSFVTVTVCAKSLPTLSATYDGPPDCTISTCIMSACEGTLVQLCGPDVAGYTYLWHGPEQDGATTQCIFVYHPGTFTLTVTDAAGRQSTCSFDAPIHPMPACTIGGGVDSLCGGGTTTWCAPEAPPGDVYKYRWDGPEQSGATTRCLTISTPGIYAVWVTSKYNCQSQCTRTLFVGGGLDCGIRGKDIVCSGQATEWCATEAPAGHTYTYLWHGPEQDGATTRCITISTPGEYTVTIMDAVGCQSSCSKTLANYSLPNCHITGAGECCPGNPVTWCVAAVAGWTYLWHGPEQDGATTPCITISTPGDYSVTITDENGCQAFCQQGLSATTGPDCGISGRDLVCSGHSTEWCAPEAPAGSSYTYLWHGPEQDGATTRCITISTAGEYTVTVTDQNGCHSTCPKTLGNYTLPNCHITGAGACCPGKPVTWCVADVPAWTYLWSGPEQNGATTPCITISTPGDYAVTVTDENGCQSSCKQGLSASNGPDCSIAGDTTACTGGRVTWCGPDVSGYTYLWTGPEQSGTTSRCITIGTAGTYSLTVTDTAGCQSTCQKRLTTYGQPKCSITGKCAGTTLCNDCPPCPGTAVTWCGPDVQGYTYLWNGPEQDGATTRCITISTAGTYTLTLTNQAGCQSRCRSTLTYATPPVCNLVAPDPLPECGSSNNKLTASVTGSVASYSWSVAGAGWQITAGGHSSVVTYTAGAYGSTGQFTLIVASSGGCKDTCSVRFGCSRGERNCTFTQGGWGSDCPCSQKNDLRSTQPGCVRDHFFSRVFPTADGVVIGGTPFRAKWTSARAVASFLPATKSPGVLTGNLTNPTKTPAGILGGQILSLRMNREFSCAGVFYDLGLASSSWCFGNFIIPVSSDCGNKFAGMTVDQFLALADRVVAGNLSALAPYGATLSDLNKTATCLNEMFDGCDPYRSSCNMSVTGTTDQQGPPEDNGTGTTLSLSSSASGPLTGVPAAFDVSQIYPNPINPGTTITYALPTEGRVVVEIYDVQGSKVATLVDQTQGAGYHSVYWDGMSEQGRSAPSGVYFCRAQFGEESNISRKMIKLQ